MGLRWGCSVLLVTSLGCSIEGREEPEQEPERRALMDQVAAQSYVVHVGGVCSTHFAEPDSKGGGELGNWPGFTSVDAWVDQRSSMSQATEELRQVLDEHCTGQNWCHVYTYSNGSAVLSRTLSLYDDERWNITWAMSSAGNEGGSELSGGTLASVGETLGFTCELAKHISPSDHRPGWNHHDTGGHTIYHVAGHDQWWYTGGVPDFFSGDANDGAVAYHSSGGMNDTYATDDDDPWLCYQDASWQNHEIAYTCEGYDRDHYAMKMYGLSLMGG